MRNWIIGIVVLIIIGLAAYAWFNKEAFSGLFGGGKEEEQLPEEPQAPQVKTYASSTMGISFDYAPEFTLNDAYAYMGFPTKPVHGVSLTIPESMATGTNLSADTYLSVEQLPRANNCSGDIFLTANVSSSDVTENGVEYSVASSTEAAAGNTYHEIVYALADSEPCTAIRYHIHSTQLANYDPGTVEAFDLTAVLREFDTIRRTVLLSL